MSSLVSEHLVEWLQGTKSHWNHLLKKEDSSKACKSILWTPKAGSKAGPHGRWEITWQLLCVSQWEPHYFKSGLGTRSTGITWELNRNAESWPCPKLTEWQSAHLQDAQVMHLFIFWEAPNWQHYFLPPYFLELIIYRFLPTQIIIIIVIIIIKTEFNWAHTIS